MIAALQSSFTTFAVITAVTTSIALVGNRSKRIVRKQGDGEGIAMEARPGSRWWQMVPDGRCGSPIFRPTHNPTFLDDRPRIVIRESAGLGQEIMLQA
jgi:hypothetical protein